MDRSRQTKFEREVENSGVRRYGKIRKIEKK